VRELSFIFILIAPVSHPRKERVANEKSHLCVRVRSNTRELGGMLEYVKLRRNENGVFR